MLNINDLLAMFAIGLFVLGGLCLVSGSLILIVRVPNKEVKTLATQTARLAQKGLAEDVVGLVGHASSILEGLNQLTKTTTGVGVFLIIIGILMMGGASLLVLQILKAAP